jgi:hypothetical protein
VAEQKSPVITVENVLDLNQVLGQDSGAKNAKRSPSNKKIKYQTARKTKERADNNTFLTSNSV